MAELKTHVTPHRLTIDYAPWATGVILILCTVLFLAAGMYGFVEDQITPLWWYASSGLTLLFATVFVTRERLTLDSETGKISYRKRTVYKNTYTEARLDQISAVRLVEEKSRGGSSTSPETQSTVILRQIAVSLPGETVTIPDALIGGPAVPNAHKLLEAWREKAGNA
jgi:hypothetical protein